MDNIPLDWLLDLHVAAVAALAFLKKFPPVLPSHLLFVLVGVTAVQNMGDFTLTALATRSDSVAGTLAK